MRPAPALTLTYSSPRPYTPLCHPVGLLLGHGRYSTLFDLVMRLRRFFTAPAIEQQWELLRPAIVANPSSAAAHEALGYLVLFMPTKHIGRWAGRHSAALSLLGAPAAGGVLSFSSWACGSCRPFIASSARSLCSPFSVCCLQLTSSCTSCSYVSIHMQTSVHAPVQLPA